MGNAKTRALRVPREAGDSFKSMTSLLNSGDSQGALRALRRQVGPNIDSPHQMGMAMLHMASELGSTNLVQLLVLLGAEVNLKMDRKYGCWTPLMFAASNGHDTCCRLLLENGADPNAADIWGNTPILKAACYNFPACVEVLLDFGADSIRPNRWGVLPLQKAARQGHLQVIKLLLKSKCNPNLTIDDREPAPLCGAAMYGDRECVEVLVKAGADPNLCVKGLQEQDILLETLKFYINYDHHEPNLNEYEDRCTECSIGEQKFNMVGCMEALLLGGYSVTASSFDIFLKNSWSLIESPYHQLFILMLRALPRHSNRQTLCNSIFSRLTDESLLKEIEENEQSRANLHHLLHIFYLAGHFPRLSVLSKLMLNASAGDSKRTVLLDLLQQCGFVSHKDCPKSLSQLCVVRIRACLPHNVLYSTTKLSLPSIIKDVITLSPSII